MIKDGTGSYLVGKMAGRLISLDWSIQGGSNQVTNTHTHSCCEHLEAVFQGNSVVRDNPAAVYANQFFLKRRALEKRITIKKEERGIIAKSTHIENNSLFKESCFKVF